MKATSICWDVDEEDVEDGATIDDIIGDLPVDIEIPDDLAVRYRNAATDDEREEVLDEISDFISDETGFLHCGFSIEDE